MCEQAPHICIRTDEFLALDGNDKWLSEEEATHELRKISPYDHRVSIHTKIPSVVVFCHRLPWCYTMMTRREYDQQSWLRGVP
jgi:hypothetical protein